MFDVFLWLSNRPILTLLIFTSILLPLLEKFELNNRIFYYGNNRDNGVTTLELVMIFVAFLIIILSIKWSYI